jgi:hypothetical protein
MVLDRQSPVDTLSDCTSLSIRSFSISADGKTICLLTQGYDTASAFVDMQDLFVWSSGQTRRLTFDGAAGQKGGPTISGNGSTVLFTYREGTSSSGYVTGSIYLYAIKTDGTQKTKLEPYDRGPLALTFDGTKAVTSYEAGRIINTDGSGGRDLFTTYLLRDTTMVTLQANQNLVCSQDGSRVLFLNDSDPDVAARGWYVGHLNAADAVPDAPIVQSITFNPEGMPQGDANARPFLFARITDTSGRDDITHITVNHLLAGRLDDQESNLPVHFLGLPTNSGKMPDETAADDVYSTWGKPGGKDGTINEVTVRVAAKNKSKTVFVADAVYQAR